MASITSDGVTQGPLPHGIVIQYYEPLPALNAGRTYYALAAAVVAVVPGADAIPGTAVAVPAGSR